MSDYDENDFEHDSAMDDKPVKESTAATTKPKPKTADSKQVRFKTGGKIGDFDSLAKTRPHDTVDYNNMPSAYKK